MRIYINEQQEKVLISMMIRESEGEQNLLVFKYLDDNFVRADYAANTNGRPTKTDMIVWLDYNKQPYKTITKDMLFYVLQDEFKNLSGDKKVRDERLRNIVDAWINKTYNEKTGNILT